MSDPTPDSRQYRLTLVGVTFVFLVLATASSVSLHGWPGTLGMLAAGIGFGLACASATRRTDPPTDKENR